MAVIRCPQCQLPMTDAETQSGACSACRASPPLAAPAALLPGASREESAPGRSICTLPIDYKPNFPDRCVLCLRERPGAITKVVAKSEFAGPVRGWFNVDVPCCAGCEGKLHAHAVGRVLRTVLVVGASMGAAGLLFYFLGLRDAALGGASFGVVMAAIIGLVVWEASHPPAFKVDVGTTSVDYQFRDRAYACAFAELNGLKFEESSIFATVRK